MAFEISKVDVWAGEIVDEPGALARVLAAVAGAGGEVECVIARRRPDRPGSGMVFVAPVKGKKVQEAARAAGLSPAAKLATLRVEGPYRGDAGPIIGRAIEAAGVNVRGVSGVKVGRTLVAYIGLDSLDDANKAAKAIRGLGKSAGKGGGASRKR